MAPARRLPRRPCETDFLPCNLSIPKQQSHKPDFSHPRETFFDMDFSGRSIYVRIIQRMYENVKHYFELGMKIKFARSFAEM